MAVPAAALLLIGAIAAPPAPAAWLDAYKAPVTKIIAEATSAATADFAWNRLAQLTDQFPARLSGSDNLARAIPWVAAQMTQDGLASVHTERVMVPHWVRGAEDAAIVQPYPQPLAIAALGGSVGTGPDGITAPVLVVRNYDDLEAHAADAKGKIVLYNVPFRTDIDPLVSYREGTQYRGPGASRAAAHGAVGMLLRSIGPIGHRTTHTGSLRYAADQPQIPAAAISAEDAEKLQRMHDRGDTVTVRLRLGARMLPDAESANVIAELRGREKPNESVLIGGHLDSWDLASGAMDDGGGCVATWEAVRVLQRLKLIPRRTIRLVLFTNEENGTRGGQGYRDAHKEELAQHVLVLESDNGVLPLKGFGFNGSPAARAVVEQIAGLLAPLGANHISEHFDGADIIPSQRAANIPAISPEVDMTRYFFLHHTPADTVDKIDRQDMARVIAAVASMAYVVADMPETLDRATTGTGQ